MADASGADATSENNKPLSPSIVQLGPGSASSPSPSTPATVGLALSSPGVYGYTPTPAPASAAARPAESTHGQPGMQAVPVTEIQEAAEVSVASPAVTQPSTNGKLGSVAIGSPSPERTPRASGTPLKAVAFADTQPETPQTQNKAAGQKPPDASDTASAGGSPSLASSLKELPKVAAGAAKQAGQSYVAAGKEARETAQLLARLPFLKDGDPIVLTLDKIATVVFFAGLGSSLLLLPVFMPSIFRLVYSLFCGLLLGLGLSFLFYYNKKRKAEVNELLSINLGLKGMQLVAGGLPSWISVSHHEKLQWLNNLIVELWPFVDKGVCDMIKDITAQVMPGILKTLPAGLSGVVKSIGFKHLTFGNAPMRVESIWVSPDDKDSLVLELSVKWCGDPNITLAIEIPGGQKLCPRIMDISFVATFRVMLNPLVPRIPGFVALMATVPTPPLIKYRLDFGKALGGSLAPAAVTPVVNYFMREVITKMLVWPQRIVVPILQETEQDKVEIQRLMRRHRGVLRVLVGLAKELEEAEWANTNDVCVELTTDSEYYEATSIRRAKLEGSGEVVRWNEYIYLLVQEPKDQAMRLEAFDVDRLRPSKILTGNFTQVVNGRQLIGRSLVKLATACQAGAEGRSEPVAVTTHLGSGEWGSPGGPGKGKGKVKLELTYWPFEKLTKYDMENAMEGIVTVRLLKVWGLAAAGDSLSAYVRVTSTANRREWKSSVQTWTRRGHVNRLKAEMARMEAARERDLREGRHREAERKAKYLEALGDAVRGNTKKARLMVDLDYTLDSNAMHAVYRVKLTDMIKIKVLESSLLSAAECLGRLDIPVADIITANDVNPMTGQREFGLHRKKWEEYNPEHPDRPVEAMERGMLLDEGEGARIWVELRWVPCVQPMDLDNEDADLPAASAGEAELA